MQIHNLKLNTTKKKKKRIGRGGKRGTYSGRGIKGQKARAGRKLPREEALMITRFPKLRGSGNLARSANKPTLILNVGQLEKIFDAGSVDKKILIKKGLIRKHSNSVKILGRGDTKKSFTVQGIVVSKGAKEKIEKAGGKVLVQEAKSVKTNKG